MKPNNAHNGVNAGANADNGALTLLTVLTAFSAVAVNAPLVPVTSVTSRCRRGKQCGKTVSTALPALTPAVASGLNAALAPLNGILC